MTSSAPTSLPMSPVEEVKSKECWRLLQSATIGRVAFVLDGQVQVFPVNYIVHRRNIYFRTSAHGAIGSVLRHAAASFQVDDSCEQLHTGWSVLVCGRAEAVDDISLLTELWGPSGPQPWAGGIRSLFIRVRPEKVTGRRINPTVVSEKQGEDNADFHVWDGPLPSSAVPRRANG